MKLEVVEDHFAQSGAMHDAKNLGTSENNKSVIYNKNNKKIEMETSFDDEGIGSTGSLSTTHNINNNPSQQVKNSPINSSNASPAAAAAVSSLSFPKLSPITYSGKDDNMCGGFLPRAANADLGGIDDDLEQYDDEADLDVNIDDNEMNNLDDDDDVDFNDLPTGGVHNDHHEFLDDEIPDDPYHMLESNNSININFNESGGGVTLPTSSSLAKEYKTSGAGGKSHQKVKFSDCINEPNWDDVPLRTSGGDGLLPASLVSTNVAASQFDYANDVDDTLPSYAELTEKMNAAAAAASSNYDGNSKFEESNSSMYGANRVNECSSTDPRFIKSNLVTNSEFGTRSIYLFTIPSTVVDIYNGENR
jgi:hypothetical protein